jgi:hypothetical protein
MHAAAGRTQCRERRYYDIARPVLDCRLQLAGEGSGCMLQMLSVEELISPITGT